MTNPDTDTHLATHIPDTRIVRPANAAPSAADPARAPGHDAQDDASDLDASSAAGDFLPDDYDIADDDLADDDIPLLPDGLPQPREQPGALLLLARVLATLGSQVDDGSWLAPTAITVVLAPPALSERVEQALERLMPEIFRCYSGSPVLRSSGGTGKSAQVRFNGAVRKALDRREPLIAVISSPADLEPSLRAALPAALPLAPLSPEMIRDVLASVFDDAADDPPADPTPDGSAPGPGAEPGGGAEPVSAPARAVRGDDPAPARVYHAGTPAVAAGATADASTGGAAGGDRRAPGASVGHAGPALERSGRPRECPLAPRAASPAAPGDRPGPLSDTREDRSPAPGPDLSLPDSAALSRLTDDDLLIAFRAETAADAIAAIRAQVRARAGSAAPSLDDIAGYGEAEATARRLVADLCRWQRGEIRWRDMTRSLLLEGEPGTGKTFLARAIGASAGVPFHASSLAEWQAAGHLGDTLRAMQAVFAAARAQVPSVLFIDEIDSLGSRWAPDTHGGNYRAQVINGFLAEVDGVRDMEGILLIGATNQAEALDPAIRRPGRFDHTVRVPRPGPEAIRRILAHHLGAELPDAERERIVPLASGRSAAAIDAAIREARSRAREASRPFSASDLEAVLRPALAPSADRAWRIAVHEVGHLVVGLRLTDGVPRRIMAAPECGAVDFDWPAPPATRAEIEGHLAMRLGGRAAEEVITGEASAGAGGSDDSDLAIATDLALRLEVRFGMGTSSLLYRRDAEAALLADPDLVGRVTAHLDRALARAKAVIAEEREAVLSLVERLIAARVIEGEELARLRLRPVV